MKKENQMESNHNSITWAAALAMVLALAAAWPCVAEITYTVTTNADSGDGSLRTAIVAANASPGFDIIEFAIDPATNLTILPVTELPAITDPVLIDGTTQPGVVVQGPFSHTRDFAFAGLNLACNGSTVVGLTVTNCGTGVLLQDVANNTVQDCRMYYNYCSLRITGETASANTVISCDIGKDYASDTYGILLDDAGSGNVIGGPGTPETNLYAAGTSDGNIVAGAKYGIKISGGLGGNIVLGNFVGVTKTLWPYDFSSGGYDIRYFLGSRPTGDGICLSETDGNSVWMNLVGHCDLYGMRLEDCQEANFIHGNSIGGHYSDMVDGKLPSLSTVEIKASPGFCGNDYCGIGLWGCSNQVIGGGNPGDGNLIANNGTGIYMTCSSVFDSASQSRVVANLSSSNTVQGNDVYYNKYSNIFILYGNEDLIGGWEQGQGNFVAWPPGTNTYGSIVVSSDDATWPVEGVQIIGNIIDNWYNPLIRGIGIVGNASGVSVLRNTFANQSNALDLGGWYVYGDGPTPNDPLDADTGPNGLQNYAVVSSAWFSGESVTVNGTLDSTPASTFHVELYSAPNAYGYAYMGALDVQTDAAGHAAFTLCLPSPSSAPVQRIAMTATDAAGSTSEFSPIYTVVDHAPLADAGLDQTVTVPHDGDPATNMAPVALDGSASSDPDGDALTYLWQAGGVTLGTDASISVVLAAGTHLITLTVTDPTGAFSTAQTTVAVASEPNEPPIANAGTNQSIQTTGGSVTVALDGSGSNDADGDPLTYVWTENGSPIATGVSPSLVLAVGVHTITLTVTDAYGATATSTVVVKVTLVYTWSGVLQPIDPPNAAGVSSSVFKAGSTVPVRFALTGASAGITTLAATLSFAKVSNGVVGSDIEAVSTAAATAGNLFRYDAASGQYLFNWSTKGLTSGTYRLFIDLGDGVSRTVDVGLK